jgi:glycine dehydrogenase subunit 1
LARAAGDSHLHAAYFVREVASLPHVKVVYKKDFYNEVLLEIKKGTASAFLAALKKNKILAGVPFSWFYPTVTNRMLLAFSELHSREDIDRLVRVMGECS